MFHLGSKRKASEEAASSKSKKARTDSPIQNGVIKHESVSLLYIEHGARAVEATEQAEKDFEAKARAVLGLLRPHSRLWTSNTSLVPTKARLY